MLVKIYLKPDKIKTSSFHTKTLLNMFTKEKIVSTPRKYLPTQENIKTEYLQIKGDNLVSTTKGGNLFPPVMFDPGF